MKLAIIRQKYSAFGGAERFIERLLPGLADKGVDVSLIARKWSSGDAASASSPTASPSKTINRRRSGLNIRVSPSPRHE